MNQGEWAREIERLRSEHRRDKDGGLALAKELSRRLVEGAPSERAELRSCLVGIVESRGEMWGVAVEALTTEASSESTEALRRLLGRQDQADDVKDAVVLGLLRLGDRRSLPKLRRYVENSMDAHGPRAQTLLAWLYTMDLEVGIALGARFFAKALSGTAEPFAAPDLVAANQVHMLAKVSDDAVLQLVQRTRAIEKQAGTRLGHLFLKYLSKPFPFDSVVDAARAQRIRTALEAVIT